MNAAKGSADLHHEVGGGDVEELVPHFRQVYNSRRKNLNHTRLSTGLNKLVGSGK